MAHYNELITMVPQPTDIPNYEEFYKIFPDLTKLQATPQDKYYHAEGDVWTHTKMVCNELLKQPNYIQADDTSRFIMFYSALLHDISKPVCTKQEDDGHISAKGHSKIGAVDARVLLWKAEVPIDIRERICGVIQSHQVPFFAFAKPKAGFPARDPKFLAHKLSHQCNLNELITVAKADMLGRICAEQEQCMQDIELFEMLCTEEGCYTEPKKFPDAITKMKYFQSEGGISPDFPFYQETGSNVYMLSGLPATGKNHWISKNLAHLPVVSFDDAKAELNLTEKDNPGQAVHLVQDRIKEFLRNKQDFVFNATNLIAALRIKSLGLFHNYNAITNIICIEAPYKEILQRNNSRESSIPNSKIEQMLLKWEMPQSIEAHNVTHVDNRSLKLSFKK